MKKQAFLQLPCQPPHQKSRKPQRDYRLLIADAPYYRDAPWNSETRHGTSLRNVDAARSCVIVFSAIPPPVFPISLCAVAGSRLCSAALSWIRFHGGVLRRRLSRLSTRLSTRAVLRLYWLNSFLWIGFKNCFFKSLIL